jgi:broad specificity phosphatase PhoE
MTLLVHLARHAETEESREHRFCGSRDCRLTPDGLQMARSIASRVAGEGDWQAVLCSPLSRALDTARPAAEALGLDIEVRDGLREIDHGVWDGLTPAEVQAIDPAGFERYNQHPALSSPPGGESGFAVAARGLGVMDEIGRRFTHGDVLVMSHKATIRVLACALLGMDIDLYRLRLAVPVASFTTVEFGATGPRLRALADQSHLPPDLRSASGY